MEFLVHIKISWPKGMDPTEKERVIMEERDYAASLADRGVLVRMWRIPGRQENYGIWNAADATQLHEIISSLPVFPYMAVTVEPLAIHPVDPLRHQLINQDATAL